jgi:hypothetical protein
MFQQFELNRFDHLTLIQQLNLKLKKLAFKAFDFYKTTITDLILMLGY